MFCHRDGVGGVSRGPPASMPVVMLVCSYQSLFSYSPPSFLIFYAPFLPHLYHSEVSLQFYLSPFSLCRSLTFLCPLPPPPPSFLSHLSPFSLCRSLTFLCPLPPPPPLLIPKSPFCLLLN